MNGAKVVPSLTAALSKLKIIVLSLIEKTVIKRVGETEA